MSGRKTQSLNSPAPLKMSPARWKTQRPPPTLAHPPFQKLSTGVWTPYGSSGDLNQSGAASATPPPPPPPTLPVWTPQPSPVLSGRKEFRPVRFESPTLPRRYTAQQQQKTTTTIPPWSSAENGEGAPPPTAPASLNSVNSNSDYAETDCSGHFGPVAPSASVSDKIRSTICSSLLFLSVFSRVLVQYSKKLKIII